MKGDDGDRGDGGDADLVTSISIVLTPKTAFFENRTFSKRKEVLPRSHGGHGEITGDSRNAGRGLSFLFRPKLLCVLRDSVVKNPAHFSLST
jgi:hypothetical protein